MQLHPYVIKASRYPCSSSFGSEVTDIIHNGPLPCEQSRKSYVRVCLLLVHVGEGRSTGGNHLACTCWIYRPELASLVEAVEGRRAHVHQLYRVYSTHPLTAACLRQRGGAAGTKRKPAKSSEGQLRLALAATREHTTKTLGAASRGQSTQTARLYDLGRQGCAHTHALHWHQRLELKNLLPGSCQSSHAARTTGHMHAHTCSYDPCAACTLDKG